MPFHALLLLAVILGGTPQPSSHVASTVWFKNGHRIVARIAEARLTPSVRMAVREILRGESMADASTWADNIKTQRPDTRDLHFVNIDLASARYDAARDCPGGRCIIAAIERYRTELADSATAEIERNEALKFLIHLVGDLHQPLHVSSHGDRGGNDVAVVFFQAPQNLHQVWDGDLIERSTLDEDHYLARLESELASLDATTIARGTVVDWAMEGHQRARDYSYRMPPNHQIGQPYEDRNLPVVDRALIEAGVRLASLLNQALAGYRPSGSTPALAAGVYTDRDAIAHVGEEAMVIGTVVSVNRSSAGNIHINFGAEFPQQTFSVFIDAAHAPAVGQLDALNGKRIGIRGPIRLYKGSAEIIVTSRAQIVEQP